MSRFGQFTGGDEQKGASSDSLTRSSTVVLEQAAEDPSALDEAMKRRLHLLFDPILAEPIPKPMLELLKSV